jgi:hypothetical protein
MTVIDRDYLACPEDDIQRIQPVLVEGKVPYQKNAGGSL